MKKLMITLFMGALYSANADIIQKGAAVVIDHGDHIHIRCMPADSECFRKQDDGTVVINAFTVNSDGEEVPDPIFVVGEPIYDPTEDIWTIMTP